MHLGNLPLGSVPRRHQVYLTECVNSLVLESQLPHQIVNLLFTITHCTWESFRWAASLVDTRFRTPPRLKVLEIFLDIRSGYHD